MLVHLSAFIFPPSLWFILHSTTGLMPLKYHLVHIILWLKSTSCLLPLQDFYPRPFISHLKSIISPPFTFYIYSVTITCKQTSCSNELNVPLMLFLESVILFCFVFMEYPSPSLALLFLRTRQDNISSTKSSLEYSHKDFSLSLWFLLTRIFFIHHVFPWAIFELII